MRPERVTVPALGEGLAARAIARLPGGKRLSPLGRVALAFAILALIVGLALATEPWGFIALGSGIGLLVVVGVPAARAGLVPLAALAGAALPLLLPLLVFVAAGVVKSPRPLQVAVGLITLLLAAALIRPDWDQIRAALKRQPRYRSLLRGAAQVGVPFLVALIALGFLAQSILGVLGDSDHLARSFFVLAAGCLAAAVVLRVIGFARTAFRAAAALALLGLLARLASDVGLIPGGPLVHGSSGDFALVAGAMLALTALVEFVTSLLGRDAEAQSGISADRLPLRMRAAVFLETPVAARWVTDRLSVAGLGFALLSSALLLGAVFAAENAGRAAADEGHAPRAGQPATRPADLADAPLAAMFSPVLLFTAHEPFTPSAVDAYTRGATLTDWDGRAARIAGIRDLPTRCPGVVPAPCYVMQEACPSATAAFQCAKNLPVETAVYVRVARREQWRSCRPHHACADGSPNPFARGSGPYAPTTRILLQYWFFYPYNEWVAPVVLGDLKEIHAADWEAVTVGLSADRPLWVAYSAHCGGTYADWSQVRVAASDPAHLRPLVAVAEGSQANYRVAGQSRVPNFAVCAGLSKAGLELVSYAANIRDTTGDARIWAPGPRDLRPVDARTRPMSFPGTWAPTTRLALDNLDKSIRLAPDGPGPASPPLQRLWQEPIRAIFGGGAWEAG